MNSYALVEWHKYYPNLGNRVCMYSCIFVLFFEKQIQLFIEIQTPGSANFAINRISHQKQIGVLANVRKFIDGIQKASIII